MEKTKLYVKNEKGKYEPYKEPQPPFDNCLYRKYTIGNKTTYKPCSMSFTNDLPEGVWVILKHHYGRSMISGKYLRKMYMAEKASDIQDVSLAKLGGEERYAQYLQSNWDEITKDCKCTSDMCRAIVSALFKFGEEQQQ